MSQETTEHAVNRLLDATLIVGQTFDFDLAMERLDEFKKDNIIGLVEYIDLVDAANHRRTDGHYRNSRIYNRAVKNG